MSHGFDEVVSRLLSDVHSSILLEHEASVQHELKKRSQQQEGELEQLHAKISELRGLLGYAATCEPITGDTRVIDLERETLVLDEALLLSLSAERPPSLKARVDPVHPPPELNSHLMAPMGLPHIVEMDLVQDNAGIQQMSVGSGSGGDAAAGGHHAGSASACFQLALGATAPTESSGGGGAVTAPERPSGFLNVDGLKAHVQPFEKKKRKKKVSLMDHVHSGEESEFDDSSRDDWSENSSHSRFSGSDEVSLPQRTHKDGRSTGSNSASSAAFTGLAGRVSVHQFPAGHRRPSVSHGGGSLRGSAASVSLASARRQCGSGRESQGIAVVPNERSQSARHEDEPFAVHPAWQLDRKSTATRSICRNRAATQAFEEVVLDTNSEKKLDLVFRHAMVHPHSMKRLSWDLVSMLLVTMDVIMIPLLFFDPEDTGFTLFLGWISRVFWSLDIAASFLTSYITPNGELEQRPFLVARRYALTWMPLDLCVITFEWLEVFREDSFTAGSLAKTIRGTRGLRILRAVRLLRVARLAKTSPEVMKTLAYYMGAEEVSIFLSLLKIILIIAAITHIIACCWYGVATSFGSTSSWVKDQGLEDESGHYRYTVSLHWALGQFTGGGDIAPQNLIERTFAVAVLFPAFVISALVVSGITTAMTRLQLIGEHETRQFATLQRYLSDHGISNKLATRVSRNAQHVIAERKRNIPESCVELLEVLSTPLRMELNFEVNGPILKWHPLFQLYSKENLAGMRQICHAAVCQLFLMKDDTLFNDGEEPAEPKMFFLVSGELSYRRKGKAPEILAPPVFFSEHVLWTTSWHHNGTMVAVNECTILCLFADQFRSIAKQFRTAAFHLGFYGAEYLRALNNARGLLDFPTELNKPEQIDVMNVLRICQGDMTDGKEKPDGKAPDSFSLTRQSHDDRRSR